MPKRATKSPSLFATRGTGHSEHTVYITTKAPTAERDWAKIHPILWSEEGDRFSQDSKRIEAAWPRRHVTALCRAGWRRAGMPELKPGQTIRLAMFPRPVAKTAAPRAK